MPIHLTKKKSATVELEQSWHLVLLVLSTVTQKYSDLKVQRLKLVSDNSDYRPQLRILLV